MTGGAKKTAFPFGKASLPWLGGTGFRKRLGAGKSARAKQMERSGYAPQKKASIPLSALLGKKPKAVLQ